MDSKVQVGDRAHCIGVKEGGFMWVYVIYFFIWMIIGLIVAGLYALIFKVLGGLVLCCVCNSTRETRTIFDDDSIPFGSALLLLSLIWPITLIWGILRFIFSLFIFEDYVCPRCKQTYSSDYIREAIDRERESYITEDRRGTGMLPPDKLREIRDKIGEDMKRNGMKNPW